MCINFRRLNENTVKNINLLPSIHDLFDQLQLQGAKIFDSIDLQSAHYQVRHQPNNIVKTAFTVLRGHNIVL